MLQNHTNNTNGSFLSTALFGDDKHPAFVGAFVSMETSKEKPQGVQIGGYAVAA